MTWDQLADDATIALTIKALAANGIRAIVADSGGAARHTALQIIPKGVEIMTMTSVTMDTIGLSQHINESKEYQSVRKKLMSLDHDTHKDEMRTLGAAPQWTVGSVHAITHEGHVLIASNTGSQLPAYAYGAANILWIAGTNKIVKNTDEGIKRIYEHSLPLESERAKKAYGVPGSAVNKVLIVNKENQQGRITIILVKEKLGF